MKRLRFLAATVLIIGLLSGLGSADFACAANEITVNYLLNGESVEMREPLVCDAGTTIDLYDFGAETELLEERGIQFDPKLQKFEYYVVRDDSEEMIETPYTLPRDSEITSIAIDCRIVDRKSFNVTITDGLIEEILEVEKDKDPELPVSFNGYETEGYFFDEPLTKPYVTAKLTADITLYPKFKNRTVEVKITAVEKTAGLTPETTTTILYEKSVEVPFGEKIESPGLTDTHEFVEYKLRGKTFFNEENPIKKPLELVSEWKRKYYRVTIKGQNAEDVALLIKKWDYGTTQLEYYQVIHRYGNKFYLDEKYAEEAEFPLALTDDSLKLYATKEEVSLSPPADDPDAASSDGVPIEIETDSVPYEVKSEKGISTIRLKSLTEGFRGVFNFDDPDVVILEKTADAVTFKTPKEKIKVFVSLEPADDERKRRRKLELKEIIAISLTAALFAGAIIYLVIKKVKSKKSRFAPPSSLN